MFDEDKFPKKFLAQMIRTHPYLLLCGSLYQNRHFYSLETPTNEEGGYESMISAIRKEEPLIA